MGLGVLGRNVLHREVHVLESRPGVSVAHYALQHREANADGHIGSEGMRNRCALACVSSRSRRR